MGEEWVYLWACSEKECGEDDRTIEVKGQSASDEQDSLLVTGWWLRLPESKKPARQRWLSLQEFNLST
jgi:hypothetical protein